MLNNYIGGGQVFLHKVRMFLQVFARSLHLAILAGIILGSAVHYRQIQTLDWSAFGSYRKAELAISFDESMNSLRPSLGKKPNSKSFIDASTKHGKWARNIDPVTILRAGVFQRADQQGFELFWSIAAWGGALVAGIFFLIFLLWSKFGSGLKDEKKKEGSGVVLTAEQVRSKLKSLGQCSDFYIGKMPLVKDMETRHFLVTGATGSGKTNLIHNLLPQVEQKKQPAIVIDQTGEMIAKYYNKERGDIIFNPFDDRSKAWDFWADCSKIRHLEKFADTLIGFNSRQSNKGTTDFWEDTAQSIFVDCATYLQEQDRALFANSKYITLDVPFEDKDDAKERGANWDPDLKQWQMPTTLDKALFEQWLPEGASLQKLRKMISQTSREELYQMLKGKDSAEHFTKDNAKVAASIMSVLKTNIKPLRFLDENRSAGKFSIHQYLKDVDAGSDSWLFLANEPSTRELTIPLNAALAELVIANLMKHDRPKNSKIWFVMDELAAFGRFPSLPKLMQEGRKYGACVVAGMQSSSQLFSHYGQGDANNLFALFKTKFAFQSDDPMMGKLYSSICGSETITRQQKNTSFGANEFRDGVSYNEHEKEKPLVKIDDFATLALGECYTLLPVPEVRLSKMQTPESKAIDKQAGFIEYEEPNNDIEQQDFISEPEQLKIENIDPMAIKPTDKKMSLTDQTKTCRKESTEQIKSPEEKIVEDVSMDIAH
jgi:type IV secretory pathway TraG/TraD family ATPase VirD4